MESPGYMDNVACKHACEQDKHKSCLHKRYMNGITDARVLLASCSGLRFLHSPTETVGSAAWRGLM